MRGTGLLENWKVFLGVEMHVKSAFAQHVRTALVKPACGVSELAAPPPFPDVLTILLASDNCMTFSVCKEFSVQ